MIPMKVGDKVVAPMPHGYAPIHGRIAYMWINEHGVLMAQVEYAPRHSKYVPVKSLKYDK